MIAIAEIFKMFPHKEAPYNLRSTTSTSRKTGMKQLFEDSFQEGCDAIAREMGYTPPKSKKL